MTPRATTRLIPTAALTATFVAAVLFAIQHPSAAMWVGVLALVLAVCGLFTLAVETVRLREDLADAERKAEVLTDALMAADQENAILSGRLEDVAEVPRLRVVPEQRTPVADGYFPVHTDLDTDDLTALMRATEE